MLTAALALVAMAGGSAMAAKKIVVLKVTGDALGAPERAALTDALRKELAERPAYIVEDTPDADLIDLMFDAECVEPDAACLADIGAAQGVELIVLGETAPKGGGYELHLSLVDVKTKKQTKEARKAAPSASGLAGLAPDLITEVAGAKPAPAKPKGPALVSLAIRTAPDGADVFVNGQAVGKTPSKFEGKPGSYTIRIAKEGFQDVIRKVDLKEGAPVDLEMTLEAVVVAPPVVGQTGTGGTETPPVVDDGEEFYETWWFWTIVGAAAAGTTVGILAGTGAFDAEPAPVGNATLLVGQRPDQDFLLHLQRK